MGARGPAPKPTALKVAQGNPGRRQLNDNEPVPPPGDVAPPSWLSAVGREVWAQLAPTMIPMRVLTTADVWTFARYCEAFARYLELRQFLASKGSASTVYPVKDADGNVRYMLEIPQAAEYRQLHKMLLALEREFGLTPSARSRIRIEASGPSHSGVSAAEDEGQALLRLVSHGGPAPPRNPRKGRRSA